MSSQVPRGANILRLLRRASPNRRMHDRQVSKRLEIGTWDRDGPKEVDGRPRR